MRTTRKRVRDDLPAALTVGVVLALLAALLFAGGAQAAAKPARPTAKTPTGNVIAARPTIRWSKAARAVTYEVRVYKGSTLLVRKAGVGRSSWKSGKALPKDVALRWKVRAANAAGNGAWSTSLRFRVVSLSVGDAYGGGKVAYILRARDPGYVAGETHGLIAAVADAGVPPVIMEWSNVDSLLAGTGTALGTGRANTTAIVAQPGCVSGAAYVCDQLTVGGHGDWYLPSKDELNKLYLSQGAIGAFGDESYWSSSESAANYAWDQYFGDGSGDYNYKYFVYKVRAVRSF